ncbi:TIGR02677 family protein [Planococcus lenghuensis]|uniref:TIGR02677 family protein n=1 Tax=Planococcus lenghuensis TaxID=2213202 RepID=A0A1Q2KWT1_9BACL|nr:TIGR02677 family protein [Planococcus lenghuensis]AQQ52267.1 TIGR02677 family protein [Planococcus lenghuensis]
MKEEQFKRIKEATYLSTEKSGTYRAILRFFYIQHERMKEFLLPEEVFAHLKEYAGFEGYAMEELHGDLTQLVKWGNLFAQQESGNVRTIEEFKKRRFRYQCTPYTVEFERMLTGMEQNDTFGGSLEKTQFDRLYKCLKSIEASAEDNEETCAQHWDDVLTYFNKIRQNTSDYFAYLRSEDASEGMKSEAFLLYKDKFTAYLRDFIIALQQTASQIQGLLQSLGHRHMAAFFEKVARHEDKTFRFEQTGTEAVTEMEEKWTNIKDWFLGGEDSQYETVQRQTNEAIRRITRIVQRLGERNQQFRSRKDDYLHLADWFAGMDSVDEAHKLSSVVFGVFHTRHFHSDHIPTDDIYTDTWEEQPMDHETLPRIVKYGEKTKPTEMPDHRARKEEAKREHLKRRSEEKRVIEQYMNGSEIRLHELPAVEPYVRKLLLSWIGKAMVKEDRTIQTEYGTKVEVTLDPHETVLLESPDGTLEMPNARFRFIREEVTT